MASSYVAFDTGISPEFVELFKKDISDVSDADLTNSEIGNPGNPSNNNKIRSSKHLWIPTDYWISGMVWHYVNRANKENFQYDLTGFENEHIQYTVYETGDFYNWHVDTNLDSLYQPKLIPSYNKSLTSEKQILSGEYVRKLTFSVQLTDDNDYVGGDVHLLTPEKKSYFLPRNIGSITIFDSRISHRVLKIKSGTRRALVGWICGPRWK